MKKTLALVMTLLMLVCMTTSVFAAGNFVASPSQNEAPEVVDFDSECNGELIVYAYSMRHLLPTDLRVEFETCYTEIAEAANLGELDGKLLDLAKKLKYHIDNLAVSDLFYLHMQGCTGHDGAATAALTRDVSIDHGEYDITLDVDADMEHFVTLLNHRDGKWHVVESARKTEDGHLHFSADEYGTFAVVVNTAPVQSGDYTTIAMVVAFAAIACTMVVVLVKTRKRV